MSKDQAPALTRPLRAATLLMAAIVMVGGVGCITASVIGSAQDAVADRKRKATGAEIVKRAQQGDVQAQYLLGAMYSGQVSAWVYGFEMPYAQGKHWLEKAADAGHLSARYWRAKTRAASSCASAPSPSRPADCEPALAEMGALARQHCSLEHEPSLQSALARLQERRGQLEEADVWHALAWQRCQRNVQEYSALASRLQAASVPQAQEPARRVRVEMWRQWLSGEGAVSQASLPPAADGATAALALQRREAISKKLAEFPAPLQQNP